MDMPKFLSLLQSQSIYLSKMSCFKDHLEGGLTAADYLKVTIDAPLFDLAMNGFWPLSEPDKDNRDERLTQNEKVLDDINSSKFDSIFGPQLKTEAVEFFECAREWVYVNCWYQSKTECAAMWPLYGGKNSVCIFTDVKKLISALSFDLPNISDASVRRVEYIDHNTDFFEDSTFGPFISKSKPFSFEKEMRIVAWDKNCTPQTIGNNKLHGVSSNKIDLNSLITKIVISPVADSWFKKTVEDLCSSYNMNIQIVESELKSDRHRGFF